MKTIPVLALLTLTALSPAAISQYIDVAHVHRVEVIAPAGYCKNAYHHKARNSCNKKHNRSALSNRVVSKEYGNIFRHKKWPHAGREPARHQPYPHQYRVWYYYQGKHYQSLLPFHPGDKLRIRINVTPLLHGH